MLSGLQGDPAGAAPRHDERAVNVNLIAVLVALHGDQPRVLTIDGQHLPSGPFALTHRSLQSGMRDWVEQQTGQPIGYVEQLYTFADRDRGGAGTARMVSISYLGLTREQPRRSGGPSSLWADWYGFFPWEDRRDGPPSIVKRIQQALTDWIGLARDNALAHSRQQRCAVAFGLSPFDWNEELVLQRYELLFEAGLIAEAGEERNVPMLPGRRMGGDHRRILATGVARLRSKIKYRPVVFELLPPTFTLLQLQRSVEALAGHLLHKQNFRRLVEMQALVEETGEMSGTTGGRPAKLFRFRGDILTEREVAGSKLPMAGL